MSAVELGICQAYPVPPKLVDPDRSIAIDKIVDPKRFSNSLSMKVALYVADSAISVKISSAKPINSGRILIKATEKANQQPLLDSLKALQDDVFGKDATFRCRYVRYTKAFSV